MEASCNAEDQLYRMEEGRGYPELWTEAAGFLYALKHFFPVNLVGFWVSWHLSFMSFATYIMAWANRTEKLSLSATSASWIHTNGPSACKPTLFAY